MAVRGLSETIAGLDKAQRAVFKKRRNSLSTVGLFVQAEAQKRVPVEYGNLASSAFTEVRLDHIVTVGFTAKYAPVVHENLEQKLKGRPRASGKGVYWGPTGENKFLQKAADQNARKITRILAKGMEL